MSIADFHIQAVAGPYVLGSDGRLLPVDRKKDLRNRIRAVLRDKAIVAQVAGQIRAHEETAIPLWMAAFDASEDTQQETAQL